MEYRTILVHCDASRSVGHRLGVAVTLSEQFGAHLIGLYVRPQLEWAGSAGEEPEMGQPSAIVERILDGEQSSARSAFAKALGGSEISSEWRVVCGRAATAIATAGCAVDLIVVGQADPGEIGTQTSPTELAEQVALLAPGPVMIVPHSGVRRAPGRKVLLCWKSTREAAHSVMLALPILKVAESVVALLAGAQQLPNQAEPGADLLLWLRRHGITISTRHDVVFGDDVEGTILSCVANNDIDLVVMGFYGHSRMREWVLGGVSRGMLEKMTVPLLVAH